MPDFFDPPPDQRNVVGIGTGTARQAEQLIVGCQTCSPNDAKISFDNVLDQVTGNHSAVIDYILNVPEVQATNYGKDPRDPF
jgi:hypothetical protein